ncbi:MAG: FixH family protein [Phycisphaerae bacterium]
MEATPARTWTWPAIIAGLIVFQLAASATLIVFATSDTTFAVEPDYYQKAVHWDQISAAHRAGEALGWKLAFSVDSQADALGRRALDCELSNPAGEPIAGAAVELTAFHYAHASEPLKISLSEGAAGHYGAALPLSRPGVWEFRFAVRRAADICDFREVRELTFAAETAR